MSASTSTSSLYELLSLSPTATLEEGLDVPECQYVVRFDPFHTVKSHVQGAGRARAVGDEATAARGPLTVLRVVSDVSTPRTTCSHGRRAAKRVVLSIRGPATIAIPGN